MEIFLRTKYLWLTSRLFESDINMPFNFLQIQSNHSWIRWLMQKRCRILSCFIKFNSVFWALKLVSKNLYFALQRINLWMMLPLQVTLQFSGFFQIISKFVQSCFCSPFIFKISSSLVTLINFKRPFCFLNCFYLINVQKFSFLTVLHIQ